MECLEKVSDKVTKQPMESSSLAKAEVDEGLELSAMHQKIIKIADRSKLDWRAVAEYEKDKLKSDSKDEKLEKAERSAERKAAKKKSATTGTANRSYYKARQPPEGDSELLSCSDPLVTRRLNRILLGVIRQSQSHQPFQAPVLPVVRRAI